MHNFQNSYTLEQMRQELTSLGFEEIKTQEQVNKTMQKNQGTNFVVINSVCGCAAGNARPGVKIAMQNKILPEKLTTVFAGQDIKATQKLREHIKGYAPSSPSMALFKNGKVVFMLERMQIEGRTPEEIAAKIIGAFNVHCK